MFCRISCRVLIVIEGAGSEWLDENLAAHQGQGTHGFASCPGPLMCYVCCELPGGIALDHKTLSHAQHLLGPQDRA